MKLLLKTLLNATPLVGDVVSNIQANNGTKIGSVNVKQLGYSIIRILLTVALIKNLLTLDEIKALW